MTRPLAIITACILFFVTIPALFFCTEPLNPDKMDENTRITIISSQPSILLSESAGFEISLHLPELVRTVVVDYGDGTQDTIPVDGSKSLYNPEHRYDRDGEMVVTATAYTETVTKTSTCRIDIVRKARLVRKTAQVSGVQEKGNDLYLSVSAEGTEPITFTWYKDSSALPQSDSSTYIIQSLQEADTGKYFCVVTNNAGSDTSETYTLRVGQNLPPVIQNDSVYTKGTAEKDSSFVMYVKATGSPTLNYQWCKDNEALEDQNGDSLNFSALNLSDTGEYYCVIENDFGKAISNTFKLAVAQRSHIIVLHVGANGTISPSSGNDTVEVTEGDDQKYTFTPSEGYRIREVFIDGEPDSAAVVDYSYSFTDIRGDHSVEVTFEKRMYQATISKTGNGTVTADPSTGDSLAYGTELILEATAEEGYYFSGWDGEASGSDNPLVVTVEDNLEITAKFAQIGRYTVNVSIESDQGSVTIDPQADDYEDGTEVTLEASAKTGYTFSGWSKDTATSANPLTLTVNKTYDISADFKRKTYTIDATAAEGGSISPAGETSISHGDDTTVVITPDAGYRIGEVLIDGEADSDARSAGEVSFTNVAGNHTIAVSFVKKQFTLTVVTDADVGTVTGDVTIDPALPSYDSGATVQLIAPADDIYSFVQWSGDATGTKDTIAVVITANTTLTAHYAIARYMLIADTIGSGTIQATPAIDSPIAHATEVTITAEAAQGHKFTGWSGDFAQTSSSLTVTMNNDVSVTANFAPLDEFTINVTVDSGDGVVTPEPEKPTYKEGEQVRLIAQPGTGHSFHSWSGDTAATTDSIMITIHKDYVITAAFDRLSYTITAHSETGGTISPYEVSVLYGDDATFSIGTEAGYKVDSVTVDGDIDLGAANSGEKTFIGVRQNHTIEVFTSIEYYSIETPVEANSGEIIASIEKNPSTNSYTYGEHVTLTAPRVGDYSFFEWSGDATGTQNPIEIVMNENKTVTANYKLKIDTLTTSVIPLEGGIVSPHSGVYDRNSTITITATPDFGYSFLEWSGDGGGPNNQTAVTFNSNRHVVANFVMNPPSISGHPSDMSVYEGEKATFSVDADGIDLTYQWFKNDYPIPDSTHLTLTVSDTGRYKCIVTNTRGSTTSDQAVLSFKTTVTDYDENVYPIKRIGNQLWTTVNLRVTHYNDGTELFFYDDDHSSEWQNTASGSYCYNISRDEYGALYNWFAIGTGKLAPQGWRVPSQEDWDELTEFLGGEYEAGGKLKTTDDWNAPNTGATNSSGFTARSNGIRLSNGTFTNLRSRGYWWTTVEYSDEEQDDSARSRTLSYNYEGIDRDWSDKNCGLSVRLVRDVE